MKADGSLRPPRPPRCLYLSTGEDLPKGESLRARMLIMELMAGDIDIEVLTLCQRDAENGLYVATTSAFCKWLAPQLLLLKKELAGSVASLRAEFSGGHARQPGTLAELFAAFSMFMRFIRATTGEEVLSAADAEVLVEACRAALHEAGDAQTQYQREAEPTGRFLGLISSAISSGRAHVAGTDDLDPCNPSRWGWRLEQIGTSERWKEHGDRVGWVDGDDLYLDAAAAYRVAREISAGEAVAVSEGTLAKRLNERGLLASTDPLRKSLRVRRVIGKKRVYVLHLRAESVSGASDGEGGISV